MGRTFAAFVCSLSLLLSSVPPLRATPPAEPDNCMKATFTVEGRQHTYYYRQKHEYGGRDEGNPRTQLYKDADCAQRSSKHVYKNPDTKPPIEPTLHWVSDVGETPEYNKKFKLSAIDWKAAKGKAIGFVPIEEAERPVVPAPVEKVDGAPVPPVDAGQGLDIDPNAPHQAVLKLIQPPDRHEAVAKRFNDFLWEQSHDFIHAEARAKEGEEKTASLGVVTEWVQYVLTGKGVQLTPEQRERMKFIGLPAFTAAKYNAEPKHIAALYYIVGAGPGAPDWAKAPPKIAELLSGKPDLERMLVDCLARYTSGRPADGKAAGCHGREIKGGQMNRVQPEWHFEFFTEAALTAEQIITGNGFDPKQLRKEVEDNNNPPRAPGSVAKLPESVPSRAMGVEHLFGKWGDRNVLYVGEGSDPKVGGRKLAVAASWDQKIVAGPDGKNTVKLIPRIGVYDISNPGDIYGRSFTMDEFRKGGTFDLKEGGRSYTMKVTPNGADFEIKLSWKNPNTGKDIEAVSGNAKKEPLTQNELFRMRAEKAKELGQVVKFGDKEFYLSGQSSNAGSYLYWDKGTLERMADPSSDPLKLGPSMLASVNRMSEGVEERIPDSEIWAGKIGEQWYGLKWVAHPSYPDQGHYEPVKRDGQPAPTPEPEKEDKEKGDEESDDGEGEKPGPPARGQGWDKFEVSVGMQPYAKLNDLLDDSVKDKVRFYYSTDEYYEKNAESRIHEMKLGGLRRIKAFFNPAKFGQNIMWQEDRLNVVSGKTGRKGYILALDSDSQTQLIDLRSSALRPSGDGAPDLQAATVGLVAPNGGFTKVSDETALAFALVRAGFTDNAERDRIIADAARLAAGKPFTVYGTKESVHAVFGSKVWTLFPGPSKEMGEAKADGPSEGTTGTIMDRGKVSLGTVDANQPFPKVSGVEGIDNVEIPGTEPVEKATATPVALGTQGGVADVYAAGKAAALTARLYRAHDKTGAKAVWILAVHVVAGGQRREFGRIPLFARPPGEQYLPFPTGAVEKLYVDGITLDKFPENTNDWQIVRVRVGAVPFNEKGVVYVADSPTSGKYGNVVGVIAHWGMDGADAAKKAAAAKAIAEGNKS